MSILSHATFVSLRCVFICVFPHHISYISLYTVAVLMHKQRWASGGKIWKQETLGAVWLSEWPILLEHRRDASLHQTHQRAENLSRHFSLSFWPSSLHYAVCFFYVCLHHPLTPSPRSYFLLPCSLLWTRISTLNSPSSVGVHRRRNTPPN